MPKGKLKVATCQFAVSSSIPRNLRSIIAYMRKAKKARADIVHFPECALTGYAGIDMPDLTDLDWDLLKESTHQVMALAAKLKLWVILGSTHRLTEPNKPHNCAYLIGPDGKIANRYDKLGRLYLINYDSKRARFRDRTGRRNIPRRRNACAVVYERVYRYRNRTNAVAVFWKQLARD